MRHFAALLIRLPLPHIIFLIQPVMSQSTSATLEPIQI